MQDWQQIIVSVLGGGGIIGVLFKFIDLKRTADKHGLDREETQIGRWKAIALRAEESERETREREARSRSRAWRLVSWYRAHYFLARDRLSNEDRRDLPGSPPEDYEY